MDTIDFYFDFISPYAYLASRRIDQIASKHGRSVDWRSFRLGVTVVKVMGLRPMMETPLKNEYAENDLRRLSETMGIPLSQSLVVPDPIPPGRLLYSVPRSRRGALAKTLLNARWARGLDIGNQGILVGLADELDLAPDEIRSAFNNPHTKDALTEATAQAIRRGVFGSPTCAVGNELFWGTDRLWLLDRYLDYGLKYTG